MFGLAVRFCFSLVAVWLYLIRYFSVEAGGSLIWPNCETLASAAFFSFLPPFRRGGGVALSLHCCGERLLLGRYL